MLCSRGMRLRWVSTGFRESTELPVHQLGLVAVCVPAGRQDPGWGDGMKREELERLLAGGDETSLAALAALRGGASHVVWDGTMPAEAYAHVYRARLRRTIRVGTPTLGLER